MPLFECSKCHCVENTATANFWAEVLGDGKKPLCSECNPNIGKWHGHFEKRHIDDYIRQFGEPAIAFRLKPDGTLDDRFHK